MDRIPHEGLQVLGRLHQLLDGRDLVWDAAQIDRQQRAQHRLHDLALCLWRSRLVLSYSKLLELDGVLLVCSQRSC